MNVHEWSEANNRYLSLSLHWLRLRLQRLAQTASSSPVPAAVPPVMVGAASAAARGWFGRGAAPAVTLADTPAANAVAVDAAAQDDRLAALAAEREAAAAQQPPPALEWLAQRLGLSAFERDVLLLCAAVELDPSLPAQIGAIQGVQRPSPSFALALQLFDAPSWDALSPHAPLRYSQLLELNQLGSTPLTAAALRADERIVNYLKGLNALDERLSSLLAPLPAAVPPLAPSQLAKADEILRRLQAGGAEQPLPPVQLLGADRGSKLALAQEVAARLQRQLYRLGLDALPRHRAEFDSLARLWQRETALLPVALYIDAEELDLANAEQAAVWRSLLARELGLVFIGLREAPREDRAAVLAVEVAKPSAAEQVQGWQELLGSTGADAGGLARELASQFDFSLAEMRHARAEAEFEPAAMPRARLWAACRRIALPRLDALAQRLHPKAGWDDLVLPEESLRLLREIVGQVRQRHTVYQDWGYTRRMTRGFGINALFAGDSGTGKTMAAEVLANELQLALYRIDLSAVVSKYIGETEKNLRRLFDAAESGGAILLFDEADALFGKRSEVKDSHDRYANIEINYLLQRMEAFSGLALLATNMKSALDTAFLRRLRFVVNFAYPGAAERLRIWQRALPPEVPRDNVDFSHLARFNLSGGNIHSIALNAAFAAAQRGSAVNQVLLLAAVRTELRKLDKPVNEGDFR